MSQAGTSSECEHGSNGPSGRARPLGHYVAVVPVRCPRNLRTGAIYIPQTAKSTETLLGRVVGVGLLSADELSIGSLVIYEKQSGHKYQPAMICGEIFGAEVDEEIVLVPLAKGVPISINDKELAARIAALAALKATLQTTLPTEQTQIKEAMMRHHKRIQQIKNAREKYERSRLLNSTFDRGRGRGILAVIELEDNETLAGVSRRVW